MGQQALKGEANKMMVPKTLPAVLEVVVPPTYTT